MCYILDKCTIADNCEISHSLIGDNSFVRKGSKIKSSCIIGRNIRIPESTVLENVTVKATPPDFCRAEDKLGENAYKVPYEVETEDEDGNKLIQYSKLFYGNDEDIEFGWDDDDSDEQTECSHTRLSPPPDDTISKCCFYN